MLALNTSNLFNETKHTHVSISASDAAMIESATLAFQNHQQAAGGLFQHIRDVAIAFPTVEAFKEACEFGEDRRWPKTDGKREGDAKLPDTWRAYKSHLNAAIGFGFDISGIPSVGKLKAMLADRRAEDKADKDATAQQQELDARQKLADGAGIDLDTLDQCAVVHSDDGFVKVALPEVIQLMQVLANLEPAEQIRYSETFLELLQEDGKINIVE